MVLIHFDEEMGLVMEKGRLGKDGVCPVPCDEVQKCRCVESGYDGSDRYTRGCNDLDPPVQVCIVGRPNESFDLWVSDAVES